MYKKCLYICLIMITVMTMLVGCGKGESTVKETSTTTTETAQPTIPTKVDASKTVKCHLISKVTDDYDKIGFSETYKKSNKEETKGTMFSLLIETTDENRANEIENVIIKGSNKETVNVETNTYVLNNNKGCVVFFRTEGTKKPSDFFVQIQSFTNEKTFVAIPDNENKEIAASFATQASVSKYGDIVMFEDMPYFILQSGVLGTSVYNQDNHQYANATMGVILIPLHNINERKLSSETFNMMFYDTEKMGDNGVERTMKVNDEEMLATYKSNFAGLKGELISCHFKIKVKNEESIQDDIARRNYVINNTWLQQVSNKDVMYKISSI